MKKIVKKVDKAENITPKAEVEVSTHKSLRDIVDRDKLFTIIYSGVENESYYNILYDMGIRDFLMSYHYIQKMHINMEKRFGGKGIRLFIDSGAHTYQNDPKFADMTVEYWEEHLKKYLAWVERNKEYIFAIASFDFENLVGAEVVKRWYNEYFEPFMIRTGIPVCFVWHQNSYTSWDKYCQRYPYVGFSSVNTMGESIDLQEYASKLKQAEKYDTLVHGFGMTRTSFLPQLPFYTSDSTTWLVGLQYGEVNYWNGTKMSRLKKDKWKGEYLDRICRECNADRDKLENEDVEEMIKVNIHAFIEAEKYIRTRLKSRMYWLKPVTTKRDLSKEDVSDLFPSVDWLQDTSYPEWEKYAKNLNISIENKEEGTNAIVDCTCFCNWNNPEYKSFISKIYNDKLISEIHEMHINTICETIEEKVNDLIQFFTECVEGKNDRLLLLGTNFQTKAKERDKYIEEEEYDTQDVSKEEIQERLKGILAIPENTGEDIAPEISSLDDEIFKEQGIVPVRDEKGRLIKGQTKVRKPKKIYSEKYPKLACDTCYAAQTCPEAKAGYVCAFHKMFKRFDTRDMGDIIEAMQSMVGLNLERMQRVAIFEMLNGGLPDSTLTNMINQNMNLLNNLKQMYEFGSPEVIRYTKSVRADGTTTETAQVTNPSGGSILEKLFSSQPKPPQEDPNPNNEPPKDVIDIVVED